MDRRPTLGALLGFVIFFSSFSVMSLELSAARLCAPYFGSSVFVWGTLISVILAALSVGYWVGGRLADRYAPGTILAASLLLGGLWVGGAALAAPALLRGNVALGEVFGTLVVVALLFLVPMMAMGAVTPAILKLRIHATARVGRESGGVFLVSTLGSIVGTLATTFVLVPFVGTVRSIALVAAVLTLLGLLALGPRRLLRARGLPLLALVLAPAALFATPSLVAPLPGQLHEAETPYQYIRVVEQGGRRFLLLDQDRPFESFNSVLNEGHVTGYYYDLLNLGPAIPPSAERVLLLGMGGGTNVRTILELYPNVVVDAVEIDPGVVAAGVEHFGLQPGPRFRIFSQGARPYLAQSEQRYDVVLVDVFRGGPYVPFQLATREFYALVAEHLTPTGVLVVNVPRVAEPILNSIAAVLSDVRTVDLGHGVVAYASEREIAFPYSDRDRVPVPLEPALRRSLGRWQRWHAAAEPVFTDDRAAVELLTALQERSLPSLPDAR